MNGTADPKRFKELCNYFGMSEDASINHFDFNQLKNNFDEKTLGQHLEDMPEKTINNFDELVSIVLSNQEDKKFYLDVPLAEKIASKYNYFGHNMIVGVSGFKITNTNKRMVQIMNNTPLAKHDKVRADYNVFLHLIAYHMGNKSIIPTNNYNS